MILGYDQLFSLSLTLELLARIVLLRAIDGFTQDLSGTTVVVLQSYVLWTENCNLYLQAYGIKSDIPGLHKTITERFFDVTKLGGVLIHKVSILPELSFTNNT